MMETISTILLGMSAAALVLCCGLWITLLIVTIQEMSDDENNDLLT